MSRLTLAAAIFPLLVSPVLSAPAPVVKPPPAELPVPAAALVVAQIQGVERARGRLEKMIQAAAPDFAPLVAKMFDDALAKALDGRDLKAVNPDGRVFLVVTGFDGNGGSPPVAVLIPVKDFAAFKDKLLTDEERKSLEKGKDGVASFEANDKPVYAVDLAARGYVAVTPDRPTAELFAGKYAALAPAQMGDAVADAFLSADVSVYLNMTEINEDYGDKIRQGRQLFQVLMQQGAAAGAGVDKRQLETAKVVFDAMFQSAEDARGFALGLTFQPDGLAVRADAGFASDTETAKALVGEQPSSLTALGNLPAGMMSYTAGKMSKKLTAALSRLNQEYRAEEGDDKSAAAVAKYNEMSAEAQASGFEAAGSVPTTSLTFVAPADPAALVAQRVKALKSLTTGGAFMNVMLKEKPVVAEDAKKIGSLSLAEVKLVLDFDATTKGIPDQNLRETTVASMKRMLNEKTTMWFGVDGKRVVSVVAPDWPAAEKLLNGYLEGKDKIGDEKAFRASRARLPGDTSVASLTEVNKLLVMLSETFSDLGTTIPGLPIGKLPKLKPSVVGPAYLGFAVGLKPNAARFDLFVPADAVKIGREMLKPVLEGESGVRPDRFDSYPVGPASRRSGCEDDWRDAGPTGTDQRNSV